MTYPQLFTGPVRTQSPLTGWARASRVAGMLAISAAGWVDAVGRERAIGLWLVVLDLGLGAIALVVVSWRRRWPMGVALALGLMSTVSVSASGPGVLAVASLATRRRIPEVASAAAVTIACWVLFELVTDNPSPFWQVLAFSVVMILGAVGCGLYVGSRREQAASRRAVLV